MNRRQKKKRKKIKYIKKWYNKNCKFPNKIHIAKNRAFMKRYPWTQPYNIWDGKLCSEYGDYICNDIPCKGWERRFQLSMFEEIRKELIRCDYLDEFRVIQSKEKYAELRYYIGGIPKDCKVDEIINKYTILSRKTCQCCGKPAHMIYDHGWYEVVCEDCWNKLEQRRNKWYKNKRDIKYSDLICDDD